MEKNFRHELGVVVLDDQAGRLMSVEVDIRIDEDNYEVKGYRMHYIPMSEKAQESVPKQEN